MIRKTTDKSRGIRLGNFVQIRTIIDEEMEQVWAGKKTAKEAWTTRPGAATSSWSVREGEQGLKASVGPEGAPSARRRPALGRPSPAPPAPLIGEGTDQIAESSPPWP
jgi:hypothetical protein